MSEKLQLSATVICKNEESCIGDCLHSLDHCAEIVVVDSGSTDKTLDIIRDFASRGWPIKLIQRDWPGYARQKQFALEQATQEWVLSIDADEWVDAALRADLANVLKAPKEVAGIRLMLGRYLFGRPDPAPESTRPEFILRLVRRDKAHFDETVLVHERPSVDGAIQDAPRGYLMHQRPLRLDAQLSKEIIYARLKAEQRVAAGKKPSLLKLLFNPTLYLFRVFLLDRWFHCGRFGYIHAMTARTYSFFTESLHFQLLDKPAPLAADPRAVSVPAAPAPDLKLSAAIICCNEQDCIAKCIASLAGLAEIVVVDSGSTDATLDIVRGFAERGWPIKLIQRGWPGYARQKQYALEQASHEWVLSIDADEWLDDELRASLPSLVQAPPQVAGWKLRRALSLFGRTTPTPRATKPESILRLARRDKVRFDEDVLVHEGLIADGEIREANKGLLRHERALRLDDQIGKEVVYARLKAQQRLERGKKPSLFKLVVNPPIYFLRLYFIDRMFLCGVPGVILSGTRATYSFICEALHFQLWLESKGDARN